jgi:IS5 family transposase
MIRIYFLQQWYGYSDPVMEDALHGAFVSKQPR